MVKTRWCYICSGWQGHGELSRRRCAATEILLWETMILSAEEVNSQPRKHYNCRYRHTPPQAEETKETMNKSGNNKISRRVVKFNVLSQKTVIYGNIHGRNLRF